MAKVRLPKHTGGFVHIDTSLLLFMTCKFPLVSAKLISYIVFSYGSNS